MTDTPILGLPLLQPAQAQKHVTVNEALTRLDGLVQLRLVSRSLSTPPGVVTDGVAFGVPAGALDAWAGRDGQMAYGVNGGWDFISPQEGWRAYVRDEQAFVTHDGADWADPALSRSPHGANLRVETLEFEHDLAPGASAVTLEQIAPGSMVIAASARVTQAIGGTLNSWSLGIAGSPTQFGSGLGLGQGSYAEGLLGSPTTFYSATPLVLSADGGDFAAGQVRIAVHSFRVGLPNV